MEQMENNDNGGAQTIVMQKYFLPLNNFRYADILYVHEYQFGKWFGEPFFIFAGVYLF